MSERDDAAAPPRDEDDAAENTALIFFRWRNEAGWPVEYVTSTVEGLLGYPAAAFRSGELIYAQLIHPDDIEQVTAEVVEHSASGSERFEHLPYRVRHASGHYIWIDDRTAILRNAQGEATHYLGYLKYRARDRAGG